jgi:hypothetical protein
MAVFEGKTPLNYMPLAPEEPWHWLSSEIVKTSLLESHRKAYEIGDTPVLWKSLISPIQPKYGRPFSFCSTLFGS